MAKQNRNVLITGGTGFLGSTVTKAFLAQGDTVAVTYLFDNEVERFKQYNPELSEKVAFIYANVTDESDVQKTLQTFLSQFGHLDILVNIVGGFVGGIPTTELEEDRWDFMMNLNLKSVFLCCKTVLPHMTERGYGKIVNISARAGLKGEAGLSAYCVSKGGVRTLTEALAAEVMDSGINVNCIMPSIMDTPMNREAMPDEDHSRWVKTDDVAKVICFLTSDNSAIINGAAIPVYGRA
ncbi:MAG: SDR family NAD(P)-dependent oxidoreductase [Candidatus Poribacteria bacterium]|nr:SDR family NAD(P)-dependent oxidoreductase [Candidatus Poribacteria bacterium]